MKDSEIIENLENAVARIKRLETSLENNIQLFVKHQNKLAENSRALTLEVEQMKELNGSILETISNTLESTVKCMTSELVPLIAKGFEEKTRDMVQNNLGQLQKMSGLTNDAISKAGNVMSSYKWEMTVRRIWLGGAFWLGSMVSAGLIYYYFPQQIHQGFSDEFLKTYFVGRAVRDNFDNLDPKDKALIQEKFNKVYYLKDKE